MNHYDSYLTTADNFAVETVLLLLTQPQRDKSYSLFSSAFRQLPVLCPRNRLPLRMCNFFKKLMYHLKIRTKNYVKQKAKKKIWSMKFNN